MKRILLFPILLNLFVLSGCTKYDSKNVTDSTTSVETSSSVDNSEKVTNKQKIPDNHIGGTLSKNVKKLSTNYYQEKEREFVFYNTTDESLVRLVKLKFTDLPLDDNLDANFVQEHIANYTNNDIAVSKKIDNKNFIYHSNELNRDYKVEFTRNNQNKISWIKISD
ncbi:hypothetical protein HRD84_08865 [Enterococcus faecalis]|nr:hypothetical protein [Enterococcus faecalis]